MKTSTLNSHHFLVGLTSFERQRQREYGGIEREISDEQREADRVDLLVHRNKEDE